MKCPATSSIFRFYKCNACCVSRKRKKTISFAAGVAAICEHQTHCLGFPPPSPPHSNDDDDDRIITRLTFCVLHFDDHPEEIIKRRKRSWSDHRNETNIRCVNIRVTHCCWLRQKTDPQQRTVST